MKITVVEHELPAEQQVCPVCDNPLHDMKVEVTKTLKLEPAHFEVEEHRRHVYTCRACEQTQGEGDKIPFIRADMPNLPIPGSFATPELIAVIINSKYTNAMPLARIEREFDRMDSVRISRQKYEQLDTSMFRGILFKDLYPYEKYPSRQRYFAR
ncbi:MAG: IS66 family transposase zinc-finger binding domain-containing protein [Thermincola sp.]|nr:IS66 family transposase zinc-finger binding domain-containing protein [Thermincola sp.]